LSYIDLHTHTTASDGTLTPRELVSLAVEIGLSAIAITDHDTVGGVEEALSEGRKLGLEVIPGIEISAEFEREMHILGYYIDYCSPILQESLQRLQEFRKRRNPQIVEKLRQLGFLITIEEVEREAGGEIIGRPHIAKALVRKGYVKSIQEAFEYYLSDGKPAYIKKEKLTPQEAIQTILTAGGLPVLAHPKYLALNQDRLGKLIDQLVQWGLKGIEVYYSAHSVGETRRYLALAKKYELLVSGGSDFHGINKPDIRLGRGFGNLNISYDLVEKIKNASKKADS